MKVLLTADPSLPVPPKFYGGIERIVAGLAGSLRGRGVQVALLAHGDSTVQVEEKFSWADEKLYGVRVGIRNTLALFRAVHAFRPTIIHSFSRLGYLIPLLFGKTPKIMSYQRWTGGRQITIAALLGGRRLHFTGCSKFITSMGEASGGAWTAIPNFVDVERFRFSPTIEADAPLVFLGRVERIKGVHNAIRIAKLSGRRLLIAGNRADSGPDAAYWRQEVEPELGLNGVSYLGPVDDEQKIALLGKASAMVAPIEWDEPFGIVFIEALACGTPVISSPRGALPEIVRDGLEGFLVRNCEEGRDAVAKLGSISRATCRRRVESNFSSESVTSSYLKLYSALMR